MTNYEKIMNDMSPDKMAEIMKSSCSHCAYNGKKFCGYECITGIKKWLKSKAKKEES